MLSGIEQIKIANRVFERTHGRKRQVTSWRLVGGHYPRNRGYVPGATILELEGGGIVHFPENTPLNTAFDEADTRGYDTANVRATVAQWIETGIGATFTLT